MSVPIRNDKTSAARTQRRADGQARIDAILGSVQDGVVLIDGNGNIERINAVAEHQLGLAAGSADGQPLTMLGMPVLGANVAQMLLSGADGAVDVPIEHDGDSSVLSCTIQPVAGAAGDSPGAAIAMRDVTGQREFDKMCSEFVLRAAHELRTPLASVHMGLGLLGEKLDFPEGSRDRELYDTVQHELTRMVDLLTDLLDLSRLRMGAHLDFVDTDIGEIIRQAQARFAAAAEHGQVQWLIEMEGGLPAVSICREAMDRVFNTLIRYALIRTPPGASISLSARREPNNVVLVIADTGDPIAQAGQNVAFEPFSQPSAKRSGAGLGLAICREIVRRHGGEIEIHSRPRHGTRFTITLPVPGQTGESG